MSAVVHREWCATRCGEDGCAERGCTCNPLTGLWDKRPTSSGRFEEIKRSGDLFKGVPRDN